MICISLNFFQRVNRSNVEDNWILNWRSILISKKTLPIKNENFFSRVFSHFQLTWRLVLDKRVSVWLKIFLFFIPLTYMLIPFPGDFAPFIGMLDDVVFLIICTILFNAACPTSIKNEHKHLVNQIITVDNLKIDNLRFPTEIRDLIIGFLILIILLLVGGYLAGFAGLLLFGLGYLMSNIQRGNIMSNAVQVSDRQLPNLNRCLQNALGNLRIMDVKLFVTQNPTMNAFTFGYDEPYSIVLTSSLVEKLNDKEIQAVIGHELGHVIFEHARLISMMSGMAGLNKLIFFQWSRSCEYSADSIAFLASGRDLQSVTSSLLKLSSGITNMNIDLQAFLEQVDQESQKSTSFAELGSTHPFIINRIRRLKIIAEEL